MRPGSKLFWALPRGRIERCLAAGLTTLTLSAGLAHPAAALAAGDAVAPNATAVGPAAVSAAPARTAARPNLVVVVVDTLRADHMGAYGYGRPTSPFIDELAKTGLLFENAVAQAPWTGSSLGSLWTSRYVSETGAHAREGEDGRRNIDKHHCTRLNDARPTLAGVLAKAGYRTISVVSNSFAGRTCGILTGFQESHYQSRPAVATVGRALELVTEHLAADAKMPFFLQLHLIDVHAPTAPPGKYRTLFRGADGKPHGAQHRGWGHGAARAGDSSEVDSFIDHKTALYDSAVAYVDSQIKRFADELEDLGVAGDTVMAIVSDHGEDLWDSPDFRAKYEHDPRGLGSIGHGHSLLQELLHVPIVLVGPGVPEGRVRTRVSNLDIATTLTQLAGVKPPSGAFRGRSLLDAARREREATGGDDRSILSEDIAYGYDGKALYRGRYKYIVYTAHPKRPAFLFDLQADPREEHDLATKRPEVMREMEAALADLLADLDVPGSDRVTPVDPQSLERLRSLGYGQ